MLKIGLVGFGYWGPNYARVLSDLAGAELAVVCDPSPERLELARQRYPGVATCEDIDALLERDGVDAVIIATPASTHEALVRRALEAGRHVLVEKPMALRVEPGAALAELAAAAGRVLMVGYTFLYNAGVRKMKEGMAPDAFGDVYYLHATRTNLGPIRTDVNVVWDLAPHDIAIFNYLLGGEPRWASAIGARVLHTSRDDIAFVTLGYANEVLGNIHVSWADPNKVRESVAVGTRRRVVFNDLNDGEPVRYFHRGGSDNGATADSFGEFKLLGRHGDIVSPKVEPGEPLKTQCLEFIECIARGRTPLADGRFALGVIRTLAAIDRSMQSKGATVEV